jgi:carbohydrate kinase (thermoresistant glucokinase family)
MASQPAAANIIIVMGVCGCGKTTFGAALAERLGADFIEGDRLHPFANIEKMSRGEALQDRDREPWLKAIVTRAGELSSGGNTVVIACSALKKSYRDLLRGAGAGVEFVHLAGPMQTVLDRVGSRPDHFMPASLVESQYAALEPGAGESDVIELDLSLDVQQNLQRYLEIRRDTVGKST